MLIIVEPTERFDEIPDAWIEIARKYMLNRESGSLREIFNRQENGVYSRYTCSLV